MYFPVYLRHLALFLFLCLEGFQASSFGVARTGEFTLAFRTCRLPSYPRATTRDD